MIAMIFGLLFGLNAILRIEILYSILSIVNRNFAANLIIESMYC